MAVAPVIVSGGVVGPVVKQTSPLIMVCGGVLELVKVLETIPYVAVDPRLGAVAANAVSVCVIARSAANAKPAGRAGFRLSQVFASVIRDTTRWD